MTGLTLYVVAALAVALSSAVGAAYIYEGGWGREGRGDGELRYPLHLALSPARTVYVAD